LVCCAIICGARSYAVIAQWAEQLPAEPADRQSQSIDKALVVGLVVENPLVRIAPAHDKINSAEVLALNGLLIQLA